jgi:hypothetical protein
MNSEWKKTQIHHGQQIRIILFTQIDAPAQTRIDLIKILVLEQIKSQHREMYVLAITATQTTRMHEENIHNLGTMNKESMHLHWLRHAQRSSKFGL